MKKCVLLLIALSTTQIEAQEVSLATLTIGDLQKMVEAEGDSKRAAIQDAFETYFNAYNVGFVQGIATALIQADIVVRDVSLDFSECVPRDLSRVFYEMLSVSDARLQLILPQFAATVFAERCEEPLRALWETEVRREPKAE